VGYPQLLINVSVVELTTIKFEKIANIGNIWKTLLKKTPATKQGPMNNEHIQKDK